MKLFFLFFIVFFSFPSFSQVSLKKVEPAFWWVDMKNPHLQLLLYGNNLASYSVEIKDYPGVRLQQTSILENKNYLVLDIYIAPKTAAGTFTILFSENGVIKETYDYVLYPRRAGSAQRMGFNNADVLYLITPDRFANGDKSNDTEASLKEKQNRKAPGGRHGGDLQGVIDHLDYIASMGFTTIWLNPILENDMPTYSYHGYATTDFYKIDLRYGTNEQYKYLVKKAKEKGLKIIMDVIVNHCGWEHGWVKDPPDSQWLHYQKASQNKEFTITNHRKTVTQDPYVSQVDEEQMYNGWFVPVMPDLNQSHPVMAKYLIQNTIWWIEYADLSGIRMDTYSYSGKEYMKEWSCAVMQEYPNLNIVGEEWYLVPSILAHWQRGKNNSNGYTSCLPSLMDFPLQNKLVYSLNAQESIFKGWVDLYETLALDFIYANPYNLVIFGDNHDMSRLFTQLKENYNSFQLAITYLVTQRGIPQIYYGTEILITNPHSEKHGEIRADFPGGWQTDKVNGFTGENLNKKQKKAQEFVRKLLLWRKKNPLIHTGQMKHFSPKDGVYVFFRYDEKGKIMVVLSKNEKDYTLKLDRFSEILEKPTQAKDVISQKTIFLKDELLVPAYQPMILEIKE